MHTNAFMYMYRCTTSLSSNQKKENNKRKNNKILFCLQAFDKLREMDQVLESDSDELSKPNSKIIILRLRLAKLRCSH